MSEITTKSILTEKEIFENFQTLLEKKYIEYAYADLFAETLAISQKKLNSITKEFTGKTACELVDDKIVSVAIPILNKSNKSIKEIAWSLGYEDEYYFSRMFKKYTGFSPKKYRDRNRVVTLEK